MIAHTSWKLETSRGAFLTLNEKPDFQIFELKQVHGDRVVDIRSHIPEQSPEADGVVSSYSNPITPVIKTADCLPILLLGPHAFALLHAGWRGLANPIMAAPILQELDIREVYIGPCITGKNFEVTHEFKDNFPKSSHFFEKGHKLHFNLVEEALSQAHNLFPQAKMWASNECTWENPDYHSFRRDKTANRNWNLFLARNLVTLS